MAIEIRMKEQVFKFARNWTANVNVCALCSIKLPSNLEIYRIDAETNLKHWRSTICPHLFNNHLLSQICSSMTSMIYDAKIVIFLRSRAGDNSSNSKADNLSSETSSYLNFPLLSSSSSAIPSPAFLLLTLTFVQNNLLFVCLFVQLMLLLLWR